MAKAIHWPAPFRAEILAEETESLYAAIRLGRLYFDGGYWTDGEVVDIRCNHLKLRRAMVRGDLKACTIATLDPADYAKLKSTVQTPEALMAFLSETYGQPVTTETEITVVYYQNHPVIEDQIEHEP